MSDIEELIKLEPYQSCYEYGYQKGANDMEKAKQIIIDNLLKRLEKIKDLLPICDKDKDYCCSKSIYDCFECMTYTLDDIAKILLEQKGK